MKQVKSVYEFKRFKNSRDSDLINALKLYSKYTDPALRTDTKEIIHCLDNWNDEFEDPFYVVGLYLNKILIGFSELAFFTQEKVVIVDYLVIEKEFRKNNTFYQFIEEIRAFLHVENIEYNFIVAEVGCYLEKEPPKSAKTLIKLLKMSRFGVLKCNYYVPRVGINNFESAMRAIMMMYSENQTKQIKTETFFQIVKAIYYKYYQRWYNQFLDEEEKLKYDKEINDLISKMEKELSNKKLIEINGLNNLFPVHTDTESKFKGRKIIKIITGIVLFFVSFILVGALYLFLKSRFGFDAPTIVIISSAALFIALFVVAIVFENKSNVFSKVLGKLIDKF